MARTKISTVQPVNRTLGPPLSIADVSSAVGTSRQIGGTSGEPLVCPVTMNFISSWRGSRLEGDGRDTESDRNRRLGPSGCLLVYVGGVYLPLMNAMTTIRVEASVRDRLAALAEAHGRSLGAELAAILDDLEWETIEAGYRRLAAKPDDLAAYLAEAEAFSRIDLQDLADAAAEEYPEYNGGVAEHGRHPARGSGPRQRP